MGGTADNLTADRSVRRGIFFRISLTALVLISLAAVVLALWMTKGEMPSGHFPDFQSAMRAGLVEMGWLPARMPRSTRDIQECHDLDTNRVWMSFSFETDEMKTFVASAVHEIVSPTEPFAPPSFFAYWCPSAPQRLRKQDFPTGSLYRFAGGPKYLFVDWNAATAYYWSVHCPAGSFYADGGGEVETRGMIFVPGNLDDAFLELDFLIGPDLGLKIKTGTEKDMANYHFGLGMWLRQRWGLWGQSRFAKYFHNLGITHADDMSGIVLDSYWRHLNGVGINLAGQVAYYRHWWRFNQDPKEKTCPRDGHAMKKTRVFSYRLENGHLVRWQIWECDKHHLWKYDPDDGWLAPTWNETMKIRDPIKSHSTETRRLFPDSALMYEGDAKDVE